MHALHAAAFDHGPITDPWNERLERHSLGWALARDDAGTLVGFANAVWDGGVHVWLQDVMVDPGQQGKGIGRSLVATVARGARQAGCEWVHADFDDADAGFYARCGFTPTAAGLYQL